MPDSVVPLKVLGPGGAALNVTWDATNCPSADYHLVYGFGSTLASWQVAGGQCGLGNSGSALWSSPPDPSADSSRFAWFLLVGDDGAGSEGSWGLSSSGQERGGSQVSGLCGFATKVTWVTCAVP